MRSTARVAFVDGSTNSRTRESTLTDSTVFLKHRQDEAGESGTKETDEQRSWPMGVLHACGELRRYTPYLSMRRDMWRSRRG
jgi:hypothetical protein